MEFYDFPFSWECHHPNGFLYFSEGLKPPTRQIEKAKKKTKNMQMDKSIFSMFPLFVCPFFPLFFPFILRLHFLDFADLLFGFSFFFFALCFKF